MVVGVTVVAVVLFARLGFWQLERAQEKITILEAAAKASELPALTQLGDVNANVYRPVELTGRFDFDRQFLRDNMVFERQPGYEVYTPFVLETPGKRAGSTTILVNRGWVPLGTNRQQRPDVNPKNGQRTDIVNGLLVQPSKGFTLGAAIDESEQRWPLVLQFLDYETIFTRLDTMPVIPAVVVLDSDHPRSYAYSWKPVADGPEKHYGYAFQWFAMLFAVIVLFVYLNFVKKDEPNTA